MGKIKTLKKKKNSILLSLSFSINWSLNYFCLVCATTMWFVIMELLYVALSLVVGHLDRFCHWSRHESRALRQVLYLHWTCCWLSVWVSLSQRRWNPRCISLRPSSTVDDVAKQHCLPGTAELFLLEKLICFCFVFFPSVRLREWKLWIMLLIDFHPCKWTHHIETEGEQWCGDV